MTTRTRVLRPQHTASRVAVGAIVVAATVATGVAASSAAQDGASTPSKPSAVHLVAFEPWDEGGTTEVDNGRPGFGPGDQVLEHHRLLDPDTGDEIGEVAKEITVIETTPVGDFLFMVHSELTFDGGTIQDTGAIWFSEVEAGTAVAAATGGTGTYARANGTVRGALGERDGSPGLLLTIDLIPNR